MAGRRCHPPPQPPGPARFPPKRRGNGPKRLTAFGMHLRPVPGNGRREEKIVAGKGKAVSEDVDHKGIARSVRLATRHARAAGLLPARDPPRPAFDVRPDIDHMGKRARRAEPELRRLWHGGASCPARRRVSLARRARSPERNEGLRMGVTPVLSSGWSIPVLWGLQGCRLQATRVPWDCSEALGRSEPGAMFLEVFGRPGVQML